MDPCAGGRHGGICARFCSLGLFFFNHLQSQVLFLKAWDFFHPFCVRGWLVGDPDCRGRDPTADRYLFGGSYQGRAPGPGSGLFS